MNIGLRDPRSLGALCDKCPLSTCGQGPVFQENHGSNVTLIALGPSEAEVSEGRPHVGNGGLELGRGLAAVGQARTRVNLNNLLLCLAPGSGSPSNNLERINREVRKKNKEAGFGVDDEQRFLTPIEACRPRLLNELHGIKNIIPLGKPAAQAMIEGMTAGILAVRGNIVQPVVDGVSRRVCPTVQPAYVLRNQRYRHVFYRDLARAFRWFSGGLQWTEPTIIYQPSAAQLRTFLWSSARFHAYDTETDSIDALTANLRCVQFATCDVAMVVPLLSVDGYTRFYGEAEEREIRQLMVRWFADKTRKKVGHNCNVYDRVVVEQNLGVTPLNVLDSLALHKSCSPEMPHNLGFVGSFYTDVHAWKADHGRFGREKVWCGACNRSHGLPLRGEVLAAHLTAIATADVPTAHAWRAGVAVYDKELWRYGGLDGVVNARVMAPMIQEAMAKKQAVGPVGVGDAELLKNRNRSPVDRDHAMQVIAVGMQRAGMLVEQRCPGGCPSDPTEGKCRACWERRIRNELAHWHGVVKSLLPSKHADAAASSEFSTDDDWFARFADDEDEEGYATDDEAKWLGLDTTVFNPGSTQQVAAVLFGCWRLPKPNDVQPKDLYTKSGALSTGSAVLQAYMTDKRLAPNQKAFVHAILMWRKQKKLIGTYLVPMRYAPGERKPKCLLYPDGRIHPSWNILPLVGRFNSSGPNAQNIGSKYPNANMKDFYIPAPGRVFVGADVNQFHLAIIANLWKVQSLIDVFEKGLDPHSVSAETFMKDAYRNADGYRGFGIKVEKGTLADQMRDVAKRLRYAGAYGAKPETIFRVLRSAVDMNGQLINPRLTMPQVHLMYENWMKAEPEWERAWKDAFWTWKRRGGENGGYLESPLLGRRRPCLDQNPNDMYNFEILAGEGDIFGDMTGRFVEQVPFGYAGEGTGLINQCHDSMLAEVPVADADRVLDLMLSCMNVTYANWRIPITSAGKEGHRWSEV